MFPSCIFKLWMLIVTRHWSVIDFVTKRSKNAMAVTKADMNQFSTITRRKSEKHCRCICSAIIRDVPLLLRIIDSSLGQHFVLLRNDEKHFASKSADIVRILPARRFIRLATITLFKRHRFDRAHTLGAR